MPCSSRACRLESELFDGSLGTIFIVAQKQRRQATNPDGLSYPAFSERSRFLQENLSLQARKLAKLQRQNSQRYGVAPSLSIARVRHGGR